MEAWEWAFLRRLAMNGIFSAIGQSKCLRLESGISFRSEALRCY